MSDSLNIEKQSDSLNIEKQSDSLNIEEQIIIGVVSYNDSTPLPTKKHSTDAAFDISASLYSSQDEGSDFVRDIITILPGQTKKITTDLRFNIPEGYFVKIETRSGMALRGITVEGGIIDCDYTGEIIVILKNGGEENYHIKHGDRIAQAIIHKVLPVIFCRCDELKSAERGANGFGSSGR